jgi:GNAT superfamily N-acetyltransferase
MTPQRVATIWLELGAPPAPPERALDVRRVRPAAQAYLRLYRAVGDSVGWDARWRMAPDALSRFLDAPTTDVYWAFEGDAPIGLCELDAAPRPGEEGVELAHFGLVPEARGRGLGLSFLKHALTLAWAARRPGRIWLHTDTEDDRRALGVYRAAGFRPYREGWIDYPD